MQIFYFSGSLPTSSQVDPCLQVHRCKLHFFLLKRIPAYKFINSQVVQPAFFLTRIDPAVQVPRCKVPNCIRTDGVLLLHATLLHETKRSRPNITRNRRKTKKGLKFDEAHQKGCVDPLAINQAYKQLQKDCAADGSRKT